VARRLESNRKGRFGDLSATRDSSNSYAEPPRGVTEAGGVDTRRQQE